MNAMTYGEELRTIGAAPRLSPGPFASDLLPKFEGFATSPFLRPGAEFINASIPVFFIGRNRHGLWVARDAEGRRGGIFWRQRSALDFAHRSTRPSGCATVFPQARFELDIENAGNRFAPRLGPMTQLATRTRQRAVAVVGKMVRAVKRGLGDLRLL